MAERRFKFRAEVVLDLRRRRDEEAQRARAAADAALERAEEALDEARAKLRGACERPRESGIDADWYRNWMVGLRSAITRRTEELAGCRRERDQALARALRARRDLRVLERLRDRRQRAFELNGRRREQRLIDALAIQRYEAPTRASGGSS